MKRIIAHIGTGKTGTTTIQRALRSAERQKQLVGFSYPDLGGEAHHPVVLLCQPPGRFPRGYAQKYSNNISLLKKDTAAVKRNLEIYFSNEDNIVLSSEFFINFNPEEIRNFKDLLESLSPSADVSICVYVRDPLTYYPSFLQQKCKGSSEILDPESFYYNFKSIIESWENVFCRNVLVRPFKREFLHNGCVVNDFSKLIASVFSIEEQILDVDNHNVSFSLEALSALVEYRKLFCGDKNNRFTADTIALERIFLENKLFNDETPLKLKDEIKFIIYSRHKNDIHWLYDRYGIDYIDKSFEVSGGEVSGVSRDLCKICGLSDLFEGFDEEKNKTFLLRVINNILTTKNAE